MKILNFYIFTFFGTGGFFFHQEQPDELQREKLSVVDAKLMR